MWQEIAELRERVRKEKESGDTLARKLQDMQMQMAQQQKLFQQWAGEMHEIQENMTAQKSAEEVEMKLDAERKRRVRCLPHQGHRTDMYELSQTDDAVEHAKEMVRGSSVII